MRTTVILLTAAMAIVQGCDRERCCSCWCEGISGHAFVGGHGIKEACAEFCADRCEDEGLPLDRFEEKDECAPGGGSAMVADSGAADAAPELDAAPCRPVVASVTADSLVGTWRRTDGDRADHGKQYLAGGPGFLGNFTTGSFERGDSFVWTLDGEVVTETRASGDVFHEETVSFDGCHMVQRRQEDGRDRGWERQ